MEEFLGSQWQKILQKVGLSAVSAKDALLKMLWGRQTEWKKKVMKKEQRAEYKQMLMIQNQDIVRSDSGTAGIERLQASSS